MISPKGELCGRTVVVIFMCTMLVGATTMNTFPPRNKNRQTAALRLDHFDVSQDPVEISVTLHSNGFDPSELSIPASRFLLSLDNRSGVTELVLRLSKADGTQIRELRIAGGGGDWSEMFDLPAGSYTLAEASHSSWVCHLIVQSTSS